MKTAPLQVNKQKMIVLLLKDHKNKSFVKYFLLSMSHFTVEKRTVSLKLLFIRNILANIRNFQKHVNGEQRIGMSNSCLV